MPGEPGTPLFRVQLHDERFLDGHVDLLALRIAEHLAREAVVVGLEPGRDGGREVGRVADELLDGTARLERDRVVGLHAVARDVDAAAVHAEVAVPDELARLCTRTGEPEAVDDVVEARLEHPQQVLARGALPTARLLVRRPELLLEQPVVPARLLLLAKLEQVLALLDPSAPVLSRRVAAPLDRALLGQAALALEEELEPLPAAEAALRSEVAGH